MTENILPKFKLNYSRNGDWCIIYQDIQLGPTSIIVPNPEIGEAIVHACNAYTKFKEALDSIHQLALEVLAEEEQ